MESPDLVLDINKLNLKWTNERYRVWKRQREKGGGRGERVRKTEKRRERERERERVLTNTDAIEKRRM